MNSLILKVKTQTFGALGTITLLSTILVGMTPDHIEDINRVPSDVYVNAHVVFSSPLRISDALNIANLGSATPTMFYHEYKRGDTVFSGGYAPSLSESVDAMESHYLEAHNGYLEDASGSASDNTNSLPDVDKLLAEYDTFRSMLTDEGVLVIGMNVNVSNQAAQRLENIEGVLDVNIHANHKEGMDHTLTTAITSASPSVRRSSNRGSEASELPAVAEGMTKAPPSSQPSYQDDCVTAVNKDSLLHHGDWWPNQGYIRTANSFISLRRYVYQRFRWTNAQNLANLKVNECGAYESDAVYYNFDGFYFLGDWVDYWSTNHSGYLDTSLFDNPNERVYTVGLTDLTSLNLNTYYDTYIRTDFGNAQDDRGKVVAQLMHTPWFADPGCDCEENDPFCWFLWEGHGEFLVNAWDHLVPGQYDWTH